VVVGLSKVSQDCTMDFGTRFQSAVALILAHESNNGSIDAMQKTKGVREWRANIVSLLGGSLVDEGVHARGPLHLRAYAFPT
jgi:hypothetical protein